jgi:Tol biopolymer transport system component
MKRLYMLALTFLAGCVSTPTASPVSFFNMTLVAPSLSMRSTSAQIQRAMLESASRWATLQMEGTITRYGSDGTIAQVFQEKTWLDPINGRYRVELNGITGSDKWLKYSDGKNNYKVNLITAKTETTAFPESARVGQYVPPIKEGEAYPNPIWGQIGTPLAQLAFPSDYAQNKGIFTPLAMDSIAGRQALLIEWRFSESSAPSWKMWLDMQTAVILKLQEFSKDGSGVLDGERTVLNIIFNPTLEASLFVMPTSLSLATTPTQVGSKPVVTESNSQSEKNAGELYFFLQPRQAGGGIQLARVSGVCIFDLTKCPQMQIVQVPFAFNFTINALSWSPNGQYAAFAYSDHPNGTPTKLWRFDPTANTWVSLAEFPYIDPPFWSPDGTWLAFRMQDGLGGEEVYIVHRDGTELKKISAGLPAQGRPYIMDGWYTENVIMRSAIPGKGGSIYLVRASDGYVRPMFDTLLTKAQFIAAPDASLLAYDEYEPNSQNQVLKVMEPDGANAVTLASFTGGSLYPISWSPDSKLLAFNYYGSFTNGEPSAEVYVVGRDGNNLSSVYRGMTVGRLIFSPNGGYLLVEETTSITGGHLFVIDLATLEKKILQAPGLSTDYDWYAPSWRP